MLFSVGILSLHHSQRVCDRCCANIGGMHQRACAGISDLEGGGAEGAKGAKGAEGAEGAGEDVD